jgi:hypothetical protein
VRLAIALLGFAIASQVGQETATIQGRPNFTGSWSLEHMTADPRMRTAPAPDYLLRSEIKVAQDASQLVITRSDTPPLKFALDGSESRNTLPGLHGGPPLQFVSRVTWDRNTLIIDTTAPWALTQRWSLTRSGQLSIQDIAPNIEVSVSTTHLLYSKQ